MLRIVLIRLLVGRLAMRVEHAMTGRVERAFSPGRRGTRIAGVKDLMLQVVQGSAKQRSGKNCRTNGNLGKNFAN